MEEKLCLAELANRYDSMSKIERRAADYVLANSEAVIGMNVAELAQHAGIAGSAVIRFCKKAGYSGYPEFKLALAKELAQRPKREIPILTAGDTSERAAHKVFETGIRTLQNTLTMLDFEKMDALADRITKAGRICIFGVGTSSCVAEDAEYRLLQLGFAASSYTDILFMPVAAANMKKGDLAIAVSHSGRTQATLEALLLAKKQGAYTAAVTSYQLSPLAQEADCSMVAYPDDVNYPVEAVSARLAHICIFDAIAVMLTLRGGEGALEHLKTRNHVLENIRKKDAE